MHGSAARKYEPSEREQIESRIALILERRARSDVSPFLDFAAEEVVLRIDSWRGSPARLVFRGRDEAYRGLQELNVALENLGSEIQSMLIEDGKVALHRRARVRNRGTGSTVVLDICAFMVFVDGLIVHWDEYADTAGLQKLVEGPLL